MQLVVVFGEKFLTQDMTQRISTLHFQQNMQIHYTYTNWFMLIMRNKRYQLV